MARDELDDRVWRAAQAEHAVVDRLVSRAMAPDAAGSGALRAGGPAFAVLVVCLLAIVAIGVWTLRPPHPAEHGVYRATAIPPNESVPAEPGAPLPSSDPDGVFRSNASPVIAPAHIIRIIAEDGTTWILSTNTGDDPLPRGSAVIIGGEEEK
jgi:hypothetical protein